MSSAEELAAQARRRGEMLNDWAHPERRAPLVLPESLPAALPGAIEIYEQMLEDRR